jgi:hypothetical protein
LVTYLVSRECPVTGEAFAAMAGFYARVFVGLAPGWPAPDAATVSAEQVRDHFEEIRARDGYTVPMWSPDEIGDIVGRIEASRA